MGTGSENAYDSIAHGTHPMASKTRCKRGHPYEGDNLAIDRRGRRVCLACERARNTAAARRAAEMKVSRPKAPRVATDLHIQPADGGGATLTIHALGADGRDRVTAFALDSQLVNLLRQVGAA